MNRQDYLAEAKYYGNRALVFVLAHKVATATVIVALVAGFYARGLFAAPLTCDFTAPTLTCNVPNSGTTVPNPGTTPPPPVPVSDFAGCPAGSMLIRGLYPVKDATGSTDGAGRFKPGQIVSIKIVVPANPPTGFQSASFASSYGGSPSGAWAISEKPCDLAAPIIDTINTTTTGKKPKTAYMAGNFSQNFSFVYNFGPTGTLQAGKTYYLNLRIDTCGAADGCYFHNIRLP